MALPPEFSGDWNDYHQAHGLTATKEAIMIASTAPVTSNQMSENRRSIEQTPAKPHSRPKAPARRRGLLAGRSECHPVRDDETGRGRTCRRFRDPGVRAVCTGNAGARRGCALEWIPIFSPVRVHWLKTSDEHGRGYGRLLRNGTVPDVVRRWAMPVRSLALRNGEGCLPPCWMRACRSSGWATSASWPLPDGLSARNGGSFVERTGWHGRDYLPQGVNGA